MIERKPVAADAAPQLSPEEVAQASPALFLLLCEAQHSAQREYLFQRVLLGSVERGDGMTVLSKQKTQKLRDEADTNFRLLPDKLRAGMVKAVARFFSPVIYFVASQQLANVRLMKLVKEIQAKTTDPSIQKLILKTQKQWQEGE